MARYSIEDTTLTDIVNAIRTKKGKTDSIQVADMADEINGIESGSGESDMVLNTCKVNFYIEEYTDLIAYSLVNNGKLETI